MEEILGRKRELSNVNGGAGYVTEYRTGKGGARGGVVRELERDPNGLFALT